MRWLYLDFPCLYLELRLQRTVPAIVIEASGLRIVQWNAAAAAQGVSQGSRLSQAVHLCDGLEVFEFDPQQELNALEALAERLLKWSPNLVLVGSQGVLIELKGMWQLFTGPQEYWRLLSGWLDEQGYSYRGAFSDTALAARLFVKTLSLGEVGFVEELKQTLGHLKLDLCELPQGSALRLSRMGITCLNELWQLPRAALGQKFGESLLTYLGHLEGGLLEVHDYFVPQTQFHRLQTLTVEASDSQGVLFPLKPLLGELELYLRERHLCAFRLQLNLYFREAESVSVSVGVAAGEYKADAWLGLFQLKLERLELTEAVCEIALESLHLIPRSESTQDWLSTQSKRCGVEQLIGVLSARLGESSVQQLGKTSDPRPEKGIQWALSHHLPVKFRPMWLYAEPIQLRQRPLIIKGPERLVTGWWDGVMVQRDYFIAQHATGQWRWVCKDDKGVWFEWGRYA